MTRSEFRTSQPSSNGKPYDKIVVGAIAFKNNKVLLLKRSEQEIYYPNVFELPSGNVDNSDQSLAHALAREVEEETSLKISCVTGELSPPFEYETSKMVDGVTITKQCIQDNFLVEVEGEEILPSPEEHSVGIWAAEDEVDGLEMTEGMRKLVKQVFSEASSRMSL